MTRPRSWLLAWCLASAACGRVSLGEAPLEAGVGGAESSRSGSGAGGARAGGGAAGHGAVASVGGGGPVSNGGSLPSTGGSAPATGGTSPATGGSAPATGGTSPVSPCLRKNDQPPGPAVSDLAQLGGGECAGVTLASVIAQVRALRPDLKDITELFAPDPNRGGDGSFIYAFQRSDGGFALVFKRGGGDCPAGCTENDYFYFETGPGCQVSGIGETHRHSDQACIPSDQLPRWGIPPAAPPSAICDADLSPQDLSGRYGVITCGQYLACSLAGDKAVEQPLPMTLMLGIVQDPGDLGHGSVTLTGTGEPLIDGVAFPATFQRRSFEVNAAHSNLPSACPEEWSLHFQYDFEGFGARSLEFFQSNTPDCSQPDQYCKGVMSADLGDSFLPP